MSSMQWICHLEGGPKRVNHAALVLGDIMFVFGGAQTKLNFERLTKMDVHAFCTVTWRWSVVDTTPLWRPGMQRYWSLPSATTPFARHGHTVVAYKGMGYLFGGRNNITGCQTLYRFDPRFRHWSVVGVKSSMVGPVLDGHTAVVIGSKMYAFGGFDAHLCALTNNIYAFDFETSEWEHVVPATDTVPIGREYHSVAAIGEEMFIVGGSPMMAPKLEPDEEMTMDVWKFNTRTRIWTLIETGPDSFVPRGRSSAALVAYEGILYMYGGLELGYTNHYKEFYKFDVATEQWSELTPSGGGPAYRRRLTCCLVGSRLFFFGGSCPAIMGPNGEDLTDKTDRTMAAMGRRMKLFGDVHVLDLKTTLRTRAMVAVLANGLDYSKVPWDLKLEIKSMDPTKKPSALRKFLYRAMEYYWSHLSPGLLFDPRGFDPYNPPPNVSADFWNGGRGYDPKKPPFYFPEQLWRMMWWVGRKPSHPSP